MWLAASHQQRYTNSFISERESLHLSLYIYLTMVKIFIGNLPDGGVITNDDVRTMFEAHGLVTECEIIKNYG